MTTILDTINATEAGASIALGLGDDVAVVEFANGRFIIADVSDLAGYDEIMPLSSPVKFRDDIPRADRIARMVAKYRAA